MNSRGLVVYAHLCVVVCIRTQLVAVLMLDCITKFFCIFWLPKSCLFSFCSTPGKLLRLCDIIALFGRNDWTKLFIFVTIMYWVDKVNLLHFFVLSHYFTGRHSIICRNVEIKVLFDPWSYAVPMSHPTSLLENLRNWKCQFFFLIRIFLIRFMFLLYLILALNSQPPDIQMSYQIS